MWYLNFGSMNRSKTFLSVGVFLFSCHAWSQYVIKSAEELATLKKVPQEKVFVNHTGPVIFSGEYLYYSFHCFNAQNSRSSTISKVGYVALVNEDREYVLEQKIKLDRGVGQGDFFVGTDIPSGNYKLLGYTQWMKNNGLGQVFKDDLVIINPYAADQSRLLDTDSGGAAISEIMPGPVKMDSSTIGVLLNKSVFAKREKVSLSLRNYKGSLGYGTYTLKVRKKSRLNTPPAMNAMAYAERYQKVTREIDLKVGDSLFLPEQRGELLYGTVTRADTDVPLADTPVVVSLPGAEFVLNSATTDQDGNFYTYLRNDYKEPIAVIQVGDPDLAVDITVKAPRKLDVSDLQFGDWQFDEESAGAIKKRSIYNQIENQFFGLRPDSVLLGDPTDPFDGGVPEVFILDEYTRFPTFQETLVEILNNAGYRNNPGGNDYIRIAQDFETFKEAFNSFPAIVLFDGVYIANHEAMKDFDAKKIKAIRLIRDQFQLAGKTYQGIMAVETFDGNYYETYSALNGTKASIVRPIPKKNYFVQTYGTGDFERIPDYRMMLFWKPNIALDGNSANFEFFTSDLSGEFEILVDGFTTYGKPISVLTSITVE